MQQQDGLTDWDILAQESGKPGPAEREAEQMAPHRLGMVVGGSLSEGLRVRLDREIQIEDVAVGRYVIIQGLKRRFFGMVTDVSLDATSQAMEHTPPDVSDDFLMEVHLGTSAYGRLDVTPLLVLLDDEDEPRPVKQVPAHYAIVANATAEEVNQVFGAEEKHFKIGAPIEMEEAAIHINLERLVERSIGIFGKSGTGKSYLTRMLLDGIVKHDVAVNLIFDMHNDYGFQVPDKHAGYSVKGLQQLYPSKVAIFTLDEASSRRRNSPYNYVVQIGYDGIEPEDIEMMRQMLNLSDPQIGVVYTLHSAFGRDWLSVLLDDEPIVGEDDTEDNVSRLGKMIERGAIPASSVAALRRSLGRRVRRFDFLKPQVPENSVKKIFEYLQRGQSVVLEFGRYQNSEEAYLLVANYITRRLHNLYVDRVEKAQGDVAQEPPHLVLTIEEAHKFLDPAIARLTIFGTIARELRKYNVTLLIVDQRPSGIDDEVMSQIGTRVTGLLDSEDDIRSVFTGIAGASELRHVLARLDNREQSLIMGYAVPMPVVVQTRRYDMEYMKEEHGDIEGDELETRTDEAFRDLDRGRDRGAF